MGPRIASEESFEGMPHALSAPLWIVVPTDLEFVRPSRKMIEALLYGQGWEEDDVEEAALVATELIQNAIEHGSRNDGTESARIRLTVSETTVEFVVVDPGTGKDPMGLLDRDVEAAVPLDSPRGRGLFLINRLAVDFVRARDDNGGARVQARLECQAS